MPALGVPYKVKKGDTLWDIAGAELGSPWEWPRIYAFNHRAAVLHTGVRRIDNPDLIFAGEVIRIPKGGKVNAGSLSPRPPSPLPIPPPCPRQDPSVPRPSRLRDRLDDTFVPFAVTYPLEGLPQATALGPGYKATIKLKGALTIQLEKRVALSYAVRQGIQSSLKAETDGILGQLTSKTDVSFNPSTREVSFSNQLISSARAGALHTALAVTISSGKPVPVLRAEIIFPALQGQLAGGAFFTPNFKVILEIEPVAQPPRVTLSPRPSTNPVPAPPVAFWAFMGGATLLVGVVAVEYLSGGLATPVAGGTIAAALGMMGYGLQDAPTISGGRPVRIQ